MCIYLPIEPEPESSCVSIYLSSPSPSPSPSQVGRHAFTEADHLWRFERRAEISGCGAGEVAGVAGGVADVSQLISTR